MSILAFLNLGSSVSQTNPLALLGPRVLIVVGVSAGLLLIRDAWRLLRSGRAA